MNNAETYPPLSTGFFDFSSMVTSKCWVLWDFLKPSNIFIIYLSYKESLNYFLVHQPMDKYSMHTTLRIRIPCTCSSPTPSINNTFTQVSFGIRLEVCGGSFLQKQSMCQGRCLLLRRSSVVDVWQNSRCLRRRCSSNGFNSSYLLILLIHTKHKAIKWYLRLTPRLHFLGGTLINWVDKAKNMWIMDRQLPIKAAQWDAPLKLQGFSQNIASTSIYKRSKIWPSILRIIDLLKKVYNIRID